MALPAQNINHSAFRSMLEREKLSGSNFNDWFRSLRLFLRIEKKLNIIEQPISPNHVAGSTHQAFEDWNMIYDVHNEIACLMFGSMTLELQSYFAGFVRNYNMHYMGKTIGDLHALQIEYENGSPKKAATPQVLTIQGGRIQKPNKKPQAAKGKGKGKGKGKNKLVYVLKPKNIKPAAKEEPKKDDACHHCKEDYALESATCILNMVPIKKVDKTPYELWYGKVSNLFHLKVWGCEALVKRDTLDKL
ncbi:hypothetical protein Tco_1192747 [Tanacetum coccineum]